MAPPLDVRLLIINHKRIVMLVSDAEVDLDFKYSLLPILNKASRNKGRSGRTYMLNNHRMSSNKLESEKKQLLLYYTITPYVSIGALVSFAKILRLKGERLSEGVYGLALVSKVPHMYKI